MPIFTLILKFAGLWIISSIVAAVLARVAPVAWKGMKLVLGAFSIRKLKPAK